MLIKNENGTLVLDDGSVVARVNGPVWFGHLGCISSQKLLEKPVDRARLPVELVERLTGKEFVDAATKKLKAPPMVALALTRALQLSQLNGVELWDTMRKGSDHWRPGRLLSEAGQALQGHSFSFARDDRLCPPADLLSAFLDEASTMTFGEYAQAYAGWLQEDGRLDLAVAAVILAQARARLAVFYCTDPFIPGYADRDQWLSNIAFSARRWPLATVLRTEGCHRVVLVELVAKRLRDLGVSGQVLEVDQARIEAKPLAF